MMANDSGATFGRVEDLVTHKPGRYPAARRAPAPGLGPLIRRGRWAMYSDQSLRMSRSGHRALCRADNFRRFNNRRFGVLHSVAKSLGCQREGPPFLGHGRHRCAINLQVLAAVDRRSFRAAHIVMRSARRSTSLKRKARR
jgi:benzoylformate decarboxylase